MNWKKSGKLFNLKGVHPKLYTHVANPLPIKMNGSLYRVFFSARDSQNRSSVGAVDIDFDDMSIIKEHQLPLFNHGAKGSFYSHGVSIGNAYQCNGKTYILFMGWQIPDGQHWMGEIGRLIVNDDFSLSLESESPFLPLDAEDPVSISYPWVMKSADKYQMWYGSTIDWDAGNGEMIHVIKYAESDDGNDWNKLGVSVPFELGVAQAFSRPSVLVDKRGMYHMWYSYRCGTGRPYRIGYAKSKDGRVWERCHQEFNLDVSETGWDSIMIEYPFVHEYKNQLQMFYNGNGFGNSGFGLALSEKVSIDE